MNTQAIIHKKNTSTHFPMIHQFWRLLRNKKKIEKKRTNRLPYTPRKRGVYTGNIHLSHNRKKPGQRTQTITMRLHLSGRFKRTYSKLPQHIQGDFDKKIAVFIDNPNHRSLRTHKLKGKFESCYSFRLRDGYRVLFEYVKTDVVRLLDIGSHDIYKKK